MFMISFAFLSSQIIFVIFILEFKINKCLNEGTDNAIFCPLPLRSRHPASSPRQHPGEFGNKGEITNNYDVYYDF